MKSIKVACDFVEEAKGIIAGSWNYKKLLELNGYFETKKHYYGNRRQHQLLLGTFRDLNGNEWMVDEKVWGDNETVEFSLWEVK